MIDEGETGPALPLVRVSVELDRKGEAWRRAVWSQLSSIGGTFSKAVVVGITSNVGGEAAACDRAADVVDGALPNILRAEETGDAVSDLYGALS